MKRLAITKNNLISTIKGPWRFISIRWKLIAFALSLAILPTMIIGFLVYQTYHYEAVLNMRRDLRLIAQGWGITADVYRNELARVLKREEYLVEKRLSSVVLDVRNMVELFEEIKPGASGQELDVLLKKIASIQVGRSGYVFIIDQDGKYILSKGQVYDGREVTEGKSTKLTGVYKDILQDARRLKAYDVKVVHYPWSDPGTLESREKVAALTYLPQRRWVIGAGMPYTDFKSYELERVMQDELKDRIARQKIGEEGYLWVVNSAGKFLVSKDRLRDGEDVLSSRDRHGHFPMLEIVQQARGLEPGQALIKEYEWRNIGERSAQRRIAAVVYFPGWDWMIAASAYESDFLKGLAVIRWQIMVVCSIFVVFGSLLAILFASFISRPIRKLESIAASGDLKVVMDPEVLASNDEIGRLGHAFAGMMHNLNDKITEIERSRQELLRMNEELKKTQEQLVRSEKLAAIGQLAAGVAHEINNPLAYVISNLETLEKYVAVYEAALHDHRALGLAQAGWADLAAARQDVLDVLRRFEELRLDVISQDTKNLLEEVLDGLDRMRRIVLDLRTFARYDSEDKTDTDLEGVLDKVLIVAGGAIKDNIRIVKEYGGIPPVYCYAQRLSQVFMNMIVNAAQAMEDKGGTLTIRTRMDGLHVLVSFTDTGDGISPQVRAHIFEPFFTTKPVGKGTGLGLSISYEIIKKNGGDITVVSEQGRGAVFTVVLPLKRA